MIFVCVHIFRKVVTTVSHVSVRSSIFSVNSKYRLEIKLCLSSKCLKDFSFRELRIKILYVPGLVPVALFECTVLYIL